VYEISYSAGVEEDLRRPPAHARSLILDTIEVQLTYEPLRETKNRKLLVGIVSPWEDVTVVWELRVRSFRVFYDVNEDEGSVCGARNSSKAAAQDD